MAYRVAFGARIESANIAPTLDELFDEIDFETIADHWLARFAAYRRRERLPKF